MQVGFELGRTDSLSPLDAATVSRWLDLPAQITVELANAYKADVQNLVPQPGGVKNFWTTVVLSYATGARDEDARDDDGKPVGGPGMYYARAMILTLKEAGFDCFSGWRSAAAGTGKSSCTG